MGITSVLFPVKLDEKMGITYVLWNKFNEAESGHFTSGSCDECFIFGGHGGHFISRGWSGHFILWKLRMGTSSLEAESAHIWDRHFTSRGWRRHLISGSWSGHLISGSWSGHLISGSWDWHFISRGWDGLFNSKSWVLERKVKQYFIAASLHQTITNI